MKSDCRKAGLTSRMAALAESSACLISSRHFAPGSIILSCQIFNLLLTGESMVMSSSNACASAWL
jgi:hypothetical protein